MRQGWRVKDPSGGEDEGEAGLFSPTRGAGEAWGATSVEVAHEATRPASGGAGDGADGEDER